jgi:hypothetical protein
MDMSNNKMILDFILSLLFIFLGLKIIIVKKFYGRGGYVDFTSPFLHYPIGLFFILSGMYFLWMVFNKNDK